MKTRYFILFCLAGIIETLCLGLGMGMSIFSILSALIIVLLSIKLLGKQFINGRIIRLAIAFSIMQIVLGNIPVAVASSIERMQPLAFHLDGFALSVASVIFKGSLDHYVYFWLTQSFIFTAVFLIIFYFFSHLIRRTDNGVSAGTLQD